MRLRIKRLLRFGVDLATRLLDAVRLRAHGVALPVLPGGWAIGYADARAIAGELDRFVQRGSVNVIEFGSGVSTFVILSKLREKFGSAYRFVSVEADRQWFDNMSRKTRAKFAGAAGQFSLMHVDYSPSGDDRTFDLDRIWGSVPFSSCDVALVDAPPDTHGEDVRLKLCLELVPRLSPKGVLILHDTNRIHELYAYSRLSERFHLSRRLETRKGLSVFWFPREPG